jgi:2-hydroxy-6-oxonona-2,4-dienedioate hydrolase
MVTHVFAPPRSTSSINASVQRYRMAEQALWEHYDLQPRERFLTLKSPRARLRALEVGSGEPVLFVHGTIGPGAWPMLIRELPGFRCIVLERPGWGLSDPLDFSGRPYGPLVADILRSALDELEVASAYIVGGSIGNVWALRLAEQFPACVRRTVLLGGSPLVPDAPVPGIIRLIASPLGAIMVRVPDTRKRVRSILGQSGHGPSLECGRIPDVLVDWRVALGRETPSMRHERDMVRTIVRGNRYHSGLTFDDSQLAAVQQPTLYVFGTADPVGTVQTWQRAVGKLPRGKLNVLDDAGHMPWFDAPTQVGADVRLFLTK